MARRCDIGILAAIFIFVVAGAGSGAEETWLRYATVGASGARNLPMAFNPLEVSVHPPSDVAMPGFSGWIQYYGRIESLMSPSGSVAVVLDVGNDNRDIYVDSNCDGSLADEKPVKSDVIMYGRTAFGPVKVVFPTDDGPVAYHILPYSGAPGENFVMYVSSACYYEGTVNVGGVSYGVKLVDTNCNGTFNDAFSKEATSDTVVLGGPGGETTLLVGRYVEVGGNLYEAEIARDGAYVRFSPATDIATGKVLVPGEVMTLTVAGENGSFSLASPGGSLTVPAGDYYVQSWTLQRTDDKGITWTVYAAAGADAQAISVTAGGETALDISDPFKATVDVAFRGGEYVINGGLKGRLGERIAVTAASRSVAKPEVRITNADGTYDKTFSLEYG